MQAALANLGVGPMPSYGTQANTLEGEVEDYLAAPTKLVDIVEFWQVCRNPTIIVKEYLSNGHVPGAPEKVANSLQACLRSDSHSSYFSTM